MSRRGLHIHIENRIFHIEDGIYYIKYGINGEKHSPILNYSKKIVILNQIQLTS